MKVALVYPDCLDLARFKEKRKEFPPFGVLYLASSMEKEGIGVRIFSISPGSEKLDLRGFNAVGFSIPSSATYGLVRRSRFESTLDEDALVMVGGVHANFFPEKTLSDLKPDVLGIGECEETIIEILAQAETRNFEDIKGVCFLKGDKIVRTGPRFITKDIDWLPHPARHLLPDEDVVMNNRLSNTDIRMAHVMFTRGCPFPCRFCAAARTRSQFRSGTNAREELELLIDAYNIGGFAIVDDNFIINKRKVIDICQNISDLELKWSALSRVDTVDYELLVEMRKAGCIEIKFGVESGDESLLAAMGKKITKDQIIYGLQAAHDAGIKLKLFLIHGYPGENESTTAATIKLLETIEPMIERVSLFRFVPLPGTYVYNNASIFGLRNTDQEEGFNGDWGRYHIHHNNYHWWGSEKDFESMNAGYRRLKQFVDSHWA